MSGLSKSKVEWAQGWLLCNAITGCLRRCDYCWAWEMANRFSKGYLANQNMIPYESAAPWETLPNDPFWPRWWPEQLDAVRRLRKPAKIWMCNTADAFGPWVPSLMLQEMLQVARDCPQHQFLWLTKYPERLREFNPWPANCMVGATATDWPAFLDAVEYLQSVEATIKYLSMEPLLSWPSNNISTPSLLFEDAEISWVITGPLNGRLAKKHHCRAEWLDGIADACTEAGVPLFEKKECGRLITDRPLRKEFPWR